MISFYSIWLDDDTVEFSILFDSFGKLHAKYVLIVLGNDDDPEEDAFVGVSNFLLGHLKWAILKQKWLCCFPYFLDFEAIKHIGVTYFLQYCC